MFHHFCFYCFFVYIVDTSYLISLITNYNCFVLVGGKSQEWLKKLVNQFECPMTEVYLLCYQQIFPIFTNLNKFLQREEPVIYLVADQVRLYYNFM